MAAVRKMQTFTLLGFVPLAISSVIPTISTQFNQGISCGIKRPIITHSTTKGFSSPCSFSIGKTTKKEPVPSKEQWVASALSFYSETHIPEKAIDGIQTNVNGFVSRAGPYQWFQVDFGVKVEVGHAEKSIRNTQDISRSRLFREYTRWRSSRDRPAQ